MTTSLPAVFGHPPAALADTPSGATQLSPLVPGSTALEGLSPGALASLTMLAVPGTIERRHDLALALRALAPGAPFTILAPKGAGGSRLAGELEGFGCTVDDRPKAHHRICRGLRPDTLRDVEEAAAAGAPRLEPGLGLWTQPGVFSWNRLDPGTALLMEALPKLSGKGADLGCGIGVLAHPVLASDAVTELTMIDIDRRAIEAARRNAADPRARHVWTDARLVALERLDFVVMNPPFHAAGEEDKGLGVAFIRKAAASLRTGGHLWMVANKHLPYEVALKAAFKRVTPLAEANGFKVLLAVK